MSSVFCWNQRCVCVSIFVFCTKSKSIDVDGPGEHCVAVWHHIATGSSLIWPNLSERLGKMIAPVEGAVALQCTYDMPNLSRGEGKGQFLGRPANLGRGTWEIWPRASPVLVLGPWAIFIALKLTNLSPQLWPHMSSEILRCKYWICYNKVL